MSFF
jgi:hypothetical protein